MKYCVLALLGALLAGTAQTLPDSPAESSRSPAATAPEQTHRFFENLAQGDVAGAASLLAKFSSMPVEAQAELEAKLASFKRPPAIVGHVRLRQTAVVVILDRTSTRVVDLDPVFLLLDGPDWRLVPLLTRPLIPGKDLAPEITREFDQLAAWFKGTKRDLAALVRSEREAHSRDLAIANASADLQHFAASLAGGSARAVARYLSRVEMSDDELSAFLARHAESLPSLDPDTATRRITLHPTRWEATFVFADGPTFVLESTDRGESWFILQAE